MTGHGPSKPQIVAECCFLDVGQGTCSIILLGNSQGIVLDCGPRGLTPVLALKRFGVQEIVALVLSHNDSDHCAGAAQIIQSFPRRIQQVYFLEDRPARDTRLLSLIRRELDDGNLATEPRRLEAKSPRQGKLLHSDRKKGLSLHVLFPWMLANIDAREKAGPNKTSAVLVLQCRDRRVLFGGDLPIEGWEQIRRARRAPLACDVLAVPHHGGALASGSQSYEKHQSLYREAIRCDTAVISVGTRNQPGHPLPDHIRAIRDSGSAILCTQITRHCCDDLDQLRPGVVRPQLPGASLPTRSQSSSGWSRHVACCGSIVVAVGPDLIRVERLNEYRMAIDNLAAANGGHPLCRRRG